MALQLTNLPRLDDGLFNIAWQVGNAQGIVNRLLSRFGASAFPNMDLLSILVIPAFWLKLSQNPFSQSRVSIKTESSHILAITIFMEFMRQFLLVSLSHPGPQKCGRHRAYRSQPALCSQTDRE